MMEALTVMMEALIIILVIIIIVLVVFCLKLSQESKTKQIVIEVYSMIEDGSICQGKLRYYAHIKGRQEIFATGDTFYDAVGELVNSNREIFRVEYLGKDSPD